MAADLVDGGYRFTGMSPETLKITAVVVNTDIQGSVACKLSVGKDVESDGELLQSNLPRRSVQPPVIIRRGTVLVLGTQFTHKYVWKKPEIATQNVAFQDVLRQVLPVNPSPQMVLADGSEITLHLDFGDTPYLQHHRFSLNPVEQRPVVQISMAKVNQAIPGRGFYYIGLHAGGSTTFERKLASAPYPQEFSLSPPVFPSSRDGFKVVPFAQAILHLADKVRRKIFSADGVGGAQAPPRRSTGRKHTLGKTPEITVRLHLENPRAVLDQSAKMVSRRTHLLERLGRSRKVLESLAKLASSAGELHPIAKTVCVALGQIYDNFAKVEESDEQLLDLIEDMSGCLAYVDHIKSFANVGHFQGTLKTLAPMIQLTGNLVLKYPQHGFSFQTEMGDYETLRRRFERWTREFSEGLGVESLKRLVDLQALVEDQKEFLKKHRSDILDCIRPPGMDRARPIPGCLEGTREWIFRKIETWLDDITAPNILFIKGFPGAGKSAIARSLAERVANSRRFDSSFFFERDGGIFTAPSTMLRTISSDLCRYTPFRDALVADLETRKIDFSTTSIKDQFIRLVENPLQRLLNELRVGNTVVIVVDALDECGGLGRSRLQDREHILAAIVRWSKLSPLLRLVVTSRKDTPIPEVLNPISTPLELRLSSRQASRDIEVFLKLEFRKIATTHSLPDSWPTEVDIRALAKKANGLFVWAATVVKFVDQPRPHDVLQQILTGDMNVEGDITNLYRVILRIAFCADCPEPTARFLEEFKNFIGAIVTASRPLERQTPLFTILGVEMSTIGYVCRHLRSVMMEGGKYLRFSHQSFVDFLISNACSDMFRISPCVNKRKIAFALLNLLNTGLHFDPSRFRTSYDANGPRDAKRIPGEVAYACHFWADALSGDNNGDGPILAALKTFLETKFLFWLEVLSLTSQMSCARDQLLCAKNWIGPYDFDLGCFVADAIMFVDIFQECMGKSAPHIYLSAMTFTPQSSKIHQTYSPLIHPCASVDIRTAESLRVGRSDIPAPIIYVPSGTEVAVSFEGHVDDILSVLFTRDGQIASASYDATIRFWDASSGKPVLQPFTHKKAVTCLAVSRDGSILVSGSRDGTVAVWDTESYAMLEG